jgi:hypothetical protein
VPTGRVAVIVTAAAVIPVAIPSRPAIWTRIVDVSTDVHPQAASRVSASRSGPTGAKRDGSPATGGALPATTCAGASGAIGTSARIVAKIDAMIDTKVDVVVRAPIFAVDARVRTPDMIRSGYGEVNAARQVP